MGERWTDGGGEGCVDERVSRRAMADALPSNEAASARLRWYVGFVRGPPAGCGENRKHGADEGCLRGLVCSACARVHRVAPSLVAESHTHDSLIFHAPHTTRIPLLLYTLICGMEMYGIM